MKTRGTEHWGHKARQGCLAGWSPTLPWRVEPAAGRVGHGRVPGGGPHAPTSCAFTNPFRNSSTHAESLAAICAHLIAAGEGDADVGGLARAKLAVEGVVAARAQICCIALAVNHCISHSTYHTSKSRSHLRRIAQPRMPRGKPAASYASNADGRQRLRRAAGSKPSTKYSAQTNKVMKKYDS